MSRASFDKLLQYPVIKEELAVNGKMANMRGGPIIPELCMYCTLRWLAGGSYLDICDISGVSTSSFYRVIWKTIVALNKCPELAIEFPKTLDDCQRAAAGFETISERDPSTGECAIKCCVGVVDGYLLRTVTPSKTEVVGNVRSYFSGHYQCYGVNVQAVADHLSRFIYLAFAAPGVTADRYAMRSPHSSLNERVEALPTGYCIIGDAAYEATEKLVPIYQGLDKLKPKYDAFNFYASQCRIRIEMAFGMMQQKWGILQRPVSCNLVNLSLMIQAISRLHNYVINERLLAGGVDAVEKEVGRHSGNGYLASGPEYPNSDPIEVDPILSTDDIFRGHSHLREHMVDRIYKMKMKRPLANKIKAKDTHQPLLSEGN